MITYNDENRAKIISVAERLLGSSTSVDDALQAEFDNDDLTVVDFDHELLLVLDDHVTECERCGFWGETGGFNDNCECEDCQAEDEA